jgi:periplasmic divalent cation tolerance protein
MASDYLIVFCTFPSAEEARCIVRELVESKLIACGNIFPNVESIYRWKGEVESASEVFAMLKTTDEAFDRLQIKFNSLHPYDVPELVAYPIGRGLPAYLEWIRQNVPGESVPKSRG